VTRLLASMLAVLLLLTGCTVNDEPDPDEPSGPFVATDVARVDFREPLTREEAGLAPGRDSRIYERSGDAIDVEVQLPGGGVLRTEAFGLVLAGPVGQDEPERVTELRLNVRRGDTADAAEALAEQASLLGLDPLAVQAWGAAPTPTDQVFASPPGTFSASVQARRSSGDASTWTLNYDLRHQPPA